MLSEVSCESIDRNNLDANNVYCWPRQANMHIIEAVGARMGVPEDRILINIEERANTSSATIPILMWDNRDLFVKGDNLILASFGAGFAWGAIWLKWAIKHK